MTSDREVKHVDYSPSIVYQSWWIVSVYKVYHVKCKTTEYEEGFGNWLILDYPDDENDNFGEWGVVGENIFSTEKEALSKLVENLTKQKEYHKAQQQHLDDILTPLNVKLQNIS